MKTELKGLNGKVAIHCPTQEEYTQVLDLFPMDAKKRKSMDFGFDKYGNETCIADYGLYYGRIDFWKSEGYTIITASEFIALNTDQPDKERELLEKYESFLDPIVPRTSFIDKFLASIRTPAFSLQCQDGVVTDPEQMVWFCFKKHVYSVTAKGAKNVSDGTVYFSTEQAALNHRRHNTPAIKLSDMVYDAESDSYCIGLNAAHNLVNERIK